MTVKSPNVADLESTIRTFINSPRKRTALVKDVAYWNMLCSCLDAIGDTELALDAYSELPEPSGDGARYLLVYGTLQTLFIQQDAVRNLSESLGVDYPTEPLLKEIREIRNDAVGHPTKRGGGKGKAYNFISRITMSKSGFQLMTTFPDLTPTTFRHVNIPELIAKQRTNLITVLTSIVEGLESEQMTHKNQFKDQKLQDAFHPTLSYHLSKISEATFRSTVLELGRINLDVAEKMLHEFTEALEARGLTSAYVGVDNTLNLLRYPLTELRNYFEKPSETKLNEQDAYIFASFAIAQFDDLQEMAKEIDKEYESGDRQT